MKPVRKSAVGLALLAPVAAFAKGDKPNIVFFLVDDMGWVDSSVAYGEEVYPNNLRFNTPNMARLAEAGVVLTNAYACPVSTPTRTSLMTGMNAAHTHITNWTARERDTPSDASGGDIEPGSVPERETDILRRPEWNINGMSPEPGIAHTQHATPFPQLLKDAGYFTIHVGKAHWAAAGTPGASPYNMGFVVNVAGNVAGKPRSYLSEENYGNTKELWDMVAVQNMTEYYGTGIHLTEALTREALKTLDYPVRHHEPFFLYMAHHAVHTPIQPDKRFIQTAEKLTYAKASELAAELMRLFASKEVDKVELLYHHFKNTAVQVMTNKTYLPLTLQPDNGGKITVEDFIYEPSIEQLQGILLPKLLNLTIYTTLLDTLTAEHGARMMAMQVADDNANDLAQELTLQYNKSRQQVITNELLDIVGGSMN